MGDIALYPARLESFADFYGASFDHTVRAIRPIAGAFAEDVAQEALIVALLEWERVADLQSPESWVILVARRIALRRRHREARRPIAEWEHKGGGFGVDPDVQDAVVGLPDRSRAAILLHYFGDHSLGEVAGLLRCRGPAARVLVHRARRQLAEPLSGLRGSWTGERRWTEDEIVRRLEDVGDERYRDPILANVGSRSVRRVLTLDRGRYLLANDDGERLDRGTFRVDSGSVTLTPWNGGAIVLRTMVDGDVVRFTQVSNSTAPTDGVPDHVYVRLLLESEPFAWRKPASGASGAVPTRVTGT